MKLSPQHYACLDHHLRYNHFPPVSEDFIAPAARAITKVQALVDEHGGDCQTRAFDADLNALHVRMPDVRYPRGEKTRLFPVRNLMEGLHLWPYIEFQEQEEEEEYEQFTCLTCGDPTMECGCEDVEEEE